MFGVEVMEEMASKPQSELWEHHSLPELADEDIEVWADQMAMLTKGVMEKLIKVFNKHAAPALAPAMTKAKKMTKAKRTAKAKRHAERKAGDKCKEHSSSNASASMKHLPLHECTTQLGVDRGDMSLPDAPDVEMSLPTAEIILSAVEEDTLDLNTLANQLFAVQDDFEEVDPHITVNTVEDTIMDIPMMVPLEADIPLAEVVALQSTTCF
ncbi:hypothetical protein C8Q72DRAFT_883634 [Fomitopsis betulina]|nr:hypothetical protein C8Q72DRAFT_883634 [Fomitopsis betulina]